MRILVLGGTAWLGGATAAEAVARGHEVVCLARGEAGAVPEGARLIRADRDRPDAYAEAGGRWDAVLDVARHPGHVRGAIEALDAGRYLFVSTGNVYVDTSTRHGDESLPLLPPLEGDRMASMEDYGSAKVACEAAVLAAFGDRALVARAGLIGGPGDTSGRSGYWPWRFAHPSGDAVLVPDAPQRSTELIDIRDLAAWLVRCAEDGTGGVFDAVGREVPLAEHLAAAGRAADSAAAVVAAPEAWLAEQGVVEWAGPRSLPLWLAAPDWQGFTSRSGERARAAGLVHRPLDETLRDVLAWEETRPEHPHGAGLADEEERELLRLLAGA
ncbi:NAD-dependent epimerase/dehydratase family protein [Amnibacterium kyonggiense]|uniref:Nucleoside-diphosphate-sugar epimerase n=1 Tax=Amnibacterium kyonggiense TaxID=595671 RepID=A0A4V3EBA5_9MICO|nr:NAD-dependent epimerase/dehydratase family protein [Amnibacterium kyonggiense]TDS80934.1 nucleoside-diphosphate-sugar epimerase [Amnibacterium kyonggiense]